MLSGRFFPASSKEQPLTKLRKVVKKPRKQLEVKKLMIARGLFQSKPFCDSMILWLFGLQLIFIFSIIITVLVFLKETFVQSWKG